MVASVVPGILENIFEITENLAEKPLKAEEAGIFWQLLMT